MTTVATPTRHKRRPPGCRASQRCRRQRADCDQCRPPFAETCEDGIPEPTPGQRPPRARFVGHNQPDGGSNPQSPSTVGRNNAYTRPTLPMRRAVRAPANASVLAQRLPRKLHDNRRLSPTRRHEDVLDARLVQHIPWCETASDEPPTEPRFTAAPRHAQRRDVDRILLPLDSVDKRLLERQQLARLLSSTGRTPLSIPSHVGRGHHRHLVLTPSSLSYTGQSRAGTPPARPQLDRSVSCSWCCLPRFGLGETAYGRCRIPTRCQGSPCPNKPVNSEVFTVITSTYCD